MDQEGYLTKTVHSETGNGNWEGISGTHVVQPGETLSQIASAYGLKPSTLIWENDLVNSNFLQIGQNLTILPEDGITLKIKEGDNIDSIAEKYKIASTSISEANTIVDGVIREGDMIFLPGAKKIYEKPKYIASNPSVVDERPRASAQNVGTIAKVNVVSTSGKKLVFPTSGQITQWYHSGHYAYDISDTSQPPIWAAASGVVVKAQCGWNGGYGCVILIDHGGDLETLYAHLDDIYVEVGQTVEQGQVIGKQGNTGRVYGRTGIHLHFEVRENGIKLNPGNYF
jgi:murein DD-endopeptidase MepM/ murein hydrolase activator NlpD